ncbi:MAG: Rrf2 family transcriptional regulator [Clostridiales bacterium]|jgi:Rrf2 family iron-sulfur cluster assembly transcriptional regulator|nr:Rrf2 family transcriptional regulator [Clostridiales bacterium]
MKLTTKARYGLKICLELGKRPQRFISTSEISEMTGYTVKYIEKIMNSLKKAGIVRAERGAGGGYMLSRPAGEITLGEIIRPLEDNLEFIKCLGVSCCPGEKHCPTYGVWQRLYNGINSVLDSMTLQEIIDDSINMGDRHEESISGPRCNHRC